MKECFTDPLTEKQYGLVIILETVEIENYILSPGYRWMGSTHEDRYPIARAFRICKTSPFDRPHCHEKPFREAEE
ncbi:MAG: hypothetical protein NTU90_08475 [Proteobacteria bacterium]|nr:hypothetical protein [Pseudomonadota bacterium]